MRGYSATREALKAYTMMFQVIPPCGGIPDGAASGVYKTAGFKSYPLAGVFFVRRELTGTETEGFKSYPLAGVFSGLLEEE